MQNIHSELVHEGSKSNERINVLGKRAYDQDRNDVTFSRLLAKKGPLYEIKTVHLAAGNV